MKNGKKAKAPDRKVKSGKKETPRKGTVRREAALRNVKKNTIIIIIIIIIIMYIYHALINALSAHMIHINLHVIFYTHVEHSPTKTIYIK